VTAERGQRRILVTGSRAWSDELAIRSALRRHWTPGAVLVHGQCDPRDPDTGRSVPWSRAKALPPEQQARLLGADWTADRIWSGGGGLVEAHPAEWDRLGKRAGMARNAAMVERTASVCLAFILDQSPGATQCAGLAESAGIPVERCELRTGPTGGGLAGQTAARLARAGITADDPGLRQVRAWNDSRTWSRIW
jgi:hypothetical protein